MSTEKKQATDPAAAQASAQNSIAPAAARSSVETIYQVAGKDVTLSKDIVRKLLVKGSGNVTDEEVVQFIGICKYNQLNPFLNEAYLVKFGGQSASAQMVVSKEAFMKRAENNPQFDGLRAGVILKRSGEVVEVEGSFALDDDVLLGGWAEVHRKDRKFPSVARVSIAEYDKKQSVWNEKKSTMIRKTAVVQALREAFPSQLGAMYTAEEQGVQDVQFEDVSDKVAAEIAQKANAKPIALEPQPVAAGAAQAKLPLPDSTPVVTKANGPDF
jgi:phage recombination protein Bet